MNALWSLVTTPMPMPVANRLVIAYALAWHWSNTHEENPENNDGQPEILVPIREPFSKNNKRRNGFECSRDTVPHPIHVQDVPLSQGLDQEIDYSNVPGDTAEKVAQLVAACEELQLKVTEYFGERKQEYV